MPVTIQVEQENIAGELVRFANARLLAGKECEINADTPVLDIGILDSLSMVTLLTHIHTRLGVALPDEEVTPENFETFGKLADLVTRLLDTGDMAVRMRSTSALEEAARIVEASGIRRHWVEIKTGARMHMLEAAGSGPSMILLPGMGNPASSWSGVLRSLNGDRSAYAVDYLGFGLSTGANAAPDYQEQVEAVLAVMESALEPPFILVGNSAGAMVAAEITRQKRNWISALVITGFGLVPDPAAWWKRLQEMSGDPESFLEAAYHRPPNMTEPLEALIRTVLSMPAYRSFLPGAGLESMQRTFEGIRVPTLFVGGEKDRIILPEWVTAAAARVPGAQLEWLARCGHFPPAEQPEELLYVINNFLLQAAVRGEGRSDGIRVL